MTLTAALLILVSALLHVGWNLIGKRTAQTVLFYAWTMATGGLLFSPLMLLNLDQIKELPVLFWMLLLGSGFCQTFYMAGLAKAYRGANLSMVYPLARALPVVFVPLLVLLVYGQSRLDGVDILGIILILAGALAVPLGRWRDWSIRAYLNHSVGWVMVAAIATAGYSILDSIAIGQMRDSGMTAFAAGSSFVVLQAGATLLWMIPLLRLLFRESLTGLPDKHWAMIAGGFVIGTYMLVLISMSLVSEVSYVVALRQISIPLGFFIGVIWLKESLTLARIQGVLVMIAGLLMVSL